MTEFHHALRILHSTDEAAFNAAAGEVEDGASITLPGAWEKFAANPPRFFIRCDDDSSNALWRIVTRRQYRRSA